MPTGYRINRILVPIDGSDWSEWAARHAVLLAQAYTAEVIFLHVVDEQLAAELVHEGTLDGPALVRERLLEQGRTYLHHVRLLADDAGVTHREVLAEGDPCALICDTATREDVDVIVVGKIGRRGVRRILMGSITRRVIETADRPVLVVTRAPPEAAVTAS